MLTLHARVRDLTDFAAIEVRPALSIELAVKCDQILGVDKIDESISDVAFVFEVNGQVEKVILALKMCGRSKVLISKPKKKEQ